MTKIRQAPVSTRPSSPTPPPAAEAPAAPAPPPAGKKSWAAAPPAAPSARGDGFDAGKVERRARAATDTLLAAKRAAEFVKQLPPGADLQALNVLLRGTDGPTFKAVLWQLEAEGRLAPLMNDASDVHQENFAALAQRTGAFQPLTSAPERGAKLDPPVRQGMAAQADLPPSVRALAGREHHRLEAKYIDQYQAYVDRYAGAVESANSPAAIRDLGPPADFQYFDEHNRPQSNVRGHVKPAYDAINDRVAELTDRKLPGLFAEAKAQVTVKHESGARVTFSEEITADRAGTRAKREAKTGFESKAGPLSTDGEEAGVELEGAGSLKGGRDVEATAGGHTFKLGEGGVGYKKRVGDEHLNAGAGASYDPNKREVRYTAEANAQARAGDHTVDAHVEGSVGIRGISPDEVARGIDSRPGFFHRPPELGRKEWSALPEARRKDLEFYGWSDAEWKTRS